MRRARFLEQVFVLLLFVLLSAGPTLAEDSLATARALLRNGRNEEALSAAKKAQREFQTRGDRRGEALGLLLMASAEWEIGDLDGAARDFARSAEMFEAAGDDLGAWLAAGQSGNVERLRKHPSEALAHYEQSLALLQRAAGSSAPLPLQTLEYIGIAKSGAERSFVLRFAEAMSRSGIVASLTDSGRLEKAEQELARLVEVAQPLKGAFEREIAIRRAVLRQKQGALDEARGIFRGLLDDSASSPQREKMDLLRSLTEIELASDRLKEALAWNDKALTLALNAGSEVQLDSLLLRARILTKSQRRAEAEKILGQALEVARKGGREYDQALIHESLGKMDQEGERDEQAAAHFEAAARLFHAVGQTEKEAFTWISLFQIYSQLDSRAGADAALEKVRALAPRSGSRLVEALADFMVTSHRVRAGKADFGELREKLSKLSSLPELREGRRAREGQQFLDFIKDMEQSFDGSGLPPSVRERDPARNSNAVDFPDPEILRGVNLLQRDEFAAAREVFSTCLARASDRNIEVALLVMMGLTYMGDTKGSEAIPYLIRAVEKIEQGTADLRVQELLAGYLAGHEDIFSLLVQLLASFGRTDEAFEYSERARARAFLQDLVNPRLEPGQGADAELVREAEGLRKRILDVERRMIAATGDDREHLATELKQTRDEYQSLRVRLKVTRPAPASRIHVEPQPIPKIREHIGPETTLVSYYIASFQAHAWVLDKERLQHVTLSFDPRDLLPTALCWAERIGRLKRGRGVRPLDSQCPGGTTGAEELYRNLIAPLRPYIRHPRLIIVPHGELHSLPFAALRDPRTGRYLIQDYTLSYAPSAGVLGLLHGRETPVEGKALVLGSPEKADPRFGPIPAARKEAEAVGRLLGTPPLFGKEATEGGLYDLAGKIELLHIAAHGLYEPRSPLFSRLVLAPDQERDGNLEVHEILSELDLSGVNLVVLSACETARGERSRGDEITGLTRAFLHAGSPGVISTLWNIDDEAASVLMQDFYRRLLAGAAVADALREAQMSLLSRREYGDPFFWAAFSLTGDPQGRWKAAAADAPAN